VRQMKTAAYKIFPLGINALTLELGNVISTELNDRVVALASHFERQPFAGLIETMAAYSSLTLFYDPPRVRKNFPAFATAFAAVRNLVEAALATNTETLEKNARIVEIAVDFEADFAPDLEAVAVRCNLTTKKFVEIFTSQAYRVFMLGFLPAFPYMGELDARIAAPRRDTPRLVVPQGSVGIAGRQTGIYPLDSPGGWQIVGRTDFGLFTPDAERPCALSAGDRVKFFDLRR
jgi:inhibitor of KinA